MSRWLFPQTLMVIIWLYLGVEIWCNMPGASTRDPTHDKVMRRRPDKQGRSGLQGFRKAALARTLKMISVFLMLAVLDHSLISVTQVEGLPRSLSKQNQLRTCVPQMAVSYKIIQDERSVSIQTPLLAF